MKKVTVLVQFEGPSLPQTDCSVLITLFADLPSGK